MRIKKDKNCQIWKINYDKFKYHFKFDTKMITFIENNLNTFYLFIIILLIYYLQFFIKTKFNQL